jgi:ABC-type transporter Mla MlaB component
LPVTVEWQQTQSLVRLQGGCNVSSAAELKGVLVDCLTTGKDLVLDLEEAGEIDTSTLQLLWTVTREAARLGIGISSRVSEGVAAAARNAGFRNFPAERE